MNKFISLIFTSFILVGCTQSSINDLSQISIQTERFHAPYSIYLLEEKDSIDLQEIKTLVSAKLPNYELVDSLSEESGNNEYVVKWFSDPKNEYPAPSIDYLQYSGYGLTDQEMIQLQSPTSAVLIVFSGTNKHVIDDHISINQIISSLMQDKSSIVTDYITYESFNFNSWVEIRITNFKKSNLDITSQFTIHVYRENEFCREVTLGLGKFCLPDISIQNISCNDQRSFSSLINLISQTWIEKPVLMTDSTMRLNITTLKNDSVKSRLLNSLEKDATKQARINLSLVKPQDGDAFNSQFEIIFRDKNHSSKQEQQQSLISQIFGATDQIEYINHDEKILEASEKAKKRLPALKKMFGQGFEPGYSLLLKAPFQTDNGGQEWMWVEVTQWTSESIKGILQNDPFEISSIHAGSIVSFDQNEVFDYILYLPDGTTEGNETGEIIRGDQ